MSSPEETHNTPGTVHSQHTQETKWPGLKRWIRHMAHLGQCTLLGPSFMGFGPSCQAAWTWEGQRTTEHLGLCPWGAAKWLRPGSCIKHRAYLGQCPCRAPWSLSSVDVGNTCCLGCGKPSLVHPLWALPTHASSFFFFFLQCPSLPTAQLNK